MNFDVVGAGMALTVESAMARPRDAPGVRPGRKAEGDTPPADNSRVRAEDIKRPVAESAGEKAAAEKSVAERVEEIRGLERTRLSILYDEDTDLFISRIIDRKTGEVVSQYPDESRIARLRFFAERREEAGEERVDIVV